MSYSYTPDLPRKTEKLLRNAGALLGVLLLSSSFFPKVALPWLLQLLAALSFIGVAALQMLLVRSYSYRLTDDGLFEIAERAGRLNRVVCCLYPSEIEAIEPIGSEQAKPYLDQPDRRRYSYLGTLQKKNAYWLFATVSGEKLAVAIFADERLIKVLAPM